MLKTFKRGVYLLESKLTAHKKIMEAELPKKAIIPLQQHIGAVCEPLVKKGGNVKKYQKIGDSKAPISAPVHASISGKVTEIKEYPHPLGRNVLSVVIEGDGKDEPITFERKDVEKLSKEELLDIIKEAGIVGLGGATFPTHVKLNPPKEKQVQILIINGAECEPYLTTDHRVMLEFPDQIIKGIKLIMRITKVKKTFIAIENNKKDAIKILEKQNNNSDIKIVSLKTKYPQGAEKILIKSITKKEVPSGGLPMDVGVIVHNIGTVKAIYDAVYENKPLIERIITVTGAVKEPKNVLVRIGTPIKDIIQQCGGYLGEPKKIIIGGPMMGLAQSTDNIPITKGTSGILVQNKQTVAKEKESYCIKCARCVDVCPINLMPTLIAKASEKKNFKLAKEYGALDCFECGCCAYVCPSKIPLVQKIKEAKQEIQKNE